MDENSNSLKEQERLLPIANVGRIMKQTLPQNAKISKEAKETMQECVSEFICFVTGEASEKCRKERRKTVNGDDICWALGNLGFDDYAGPLKRYLTRYRDSEGDRSSDAATRSMNNQDRKVLDSPTLMAYRNPGEASTSSGTVAVREFNGDGVDDQRNIY